MVQSKNRGIASFLRPTAVITMKRVLFYTGIVLCVLGLFPLLQYLFDYGKLSDYGKGFVWGKVLLIFLGGAMIFFGKKKGARSVQ